MHHNATKQRLSPKPMTYARREMRAPYVVTFAALSVALGAAACKSGCPEKIESGAACSSDGQECGLKEGCGPNGWRCEKGKWRQLMTYCNPPRIPEPPPTPTEPTIGPPAPDAGSPVRDR
jgi:hypothetical protein